MKLKNIIFWIITVILLALDWAALHDIIKENQPHYWFEYVMILLSLVIFYLIFRNYKK